MLPHFSELASSTQGSVTSPFARRLIRIDHPHKLLNCKAGHRLLKPRSYARLPHSSRARPPSHLALRQLLENVITNDQNAAAAYVSPHCPQRKCAIESGTGNALFGAATVRQPNKVRWKIALRRPFRTFASPPTEPNGWAHVYRATGSNGGRSV
jgi:hypothetical protein